MPVRFLLRSSDNVIAEFKRVMTFQFTCPQGHLLQAEPEHVGQQSQCPACGTMMLIPAPPPEALPLAKPITDSNAASFPKVTGQSPPAPDHGAAIPPKIDTGPPQINTGVESPVAVDSQPEFFHISCPNGHELETPREMLDQFAMCPTCNAQFQLLERESVEYKRRKAIEEEARAANLERNWLNWAIALVILVLLGLGGLMLMSVLNG
ncbi:MAG: hypothetical protein AAF497_08665 [Planctomycetota bacterium]